jgi:hypothetical protein
MLSAIASNAIQLNVICGFHQTSNSVLKDPALFQKIYDFVLPYFKAGTSLFFFGYGTKELYMDVRQTTEKKDVKKPTNALALNNFRQASLDVSSFEHAIAHGVLFLGAGMCTALEAFHLFALTNLESFASLVGYGGAGCFLFANLVALEQNMNIYAKADQLSSEASEEERQEAWQLKKSAILGIISNLGYILATAVSLLGDLTAIVLLFGSVGACSGCFKILYDFFIFYAPTSNPTCALYH